MQAMQFGEWGYDGSVCCARYLWHLSYYGMQLTRPQHTTVGAIPKDRATVRIYTLIPAENYIFALPGAPQERPYRIGCNGQYK